MRVKHRFTFPKDKDSKTIEEYLNSKNISYKLFNGIQVITLEIFEDNNFWQEVADLMSKHNILSLKECSYTKEEYDNAEWFTIRSKWRWEYPQPEDDSAYIHLTYDSSNPPVLR